MKNIEPSVSFIERLNKEISPDWIVSDLTFIEFGKNRFGAKWNHASKSKPFKMEMSLGGINEKTLTQIEDRVIEALKPNGTL